MSPAIEFLDEVIQNFLANSFFRPVEINLDTTAALALVRLEGNPDRFLPKIFDGDWARPGSHPRPASARVLRVIVDRMGIPRVIVRQGPALFVYTGLHDMSTGEYVE